MKSLFAIFCAVLGRGSRGWVPWAVLGAFVVMAYLIGVSRQVPFSAEYIRNLSGGQVLDVRFAYSPSEGAVALRALGDVGRRHYNFFQIADVAFLVIYAVALSSAIFALLRRGRLAAVFALVPVVAAIFDVLENIGVFVALRTYPDPSRAVLFAASVFGAAKLILFILALALVVFGLALALFRRWRVGHDGES
jgi:hypothetical protein